MLVSRACETTSSSFEISSSAPRTVRFCDGMGTTSILSAISTPSAIHHHVGIIIGACLGAAGGVFLLGLVFFWISLRHRYHAKTAKVQDMAPRSWLPSASRNIVAVRNSPSLSFDLTGADIETGSRWTKSTEVLDINAENVHHPPPLLSSPSPLPDPIEPYVPTLASQSTPVLCTRTDAPAAPLVLSESMNTTYTPTRSPIRPLPMLPTRSCMRRPSEKAEEARRESYRSRLRRFVASADDLWVYQREGRRERGRAHSISSMSGEVGECQAVQHHDGVANARIDVPPPYHECLQVQAATSTLHSASRAIR
jgi:hypothetical protein